MTCTIRAYRADDKANVLELVKLNTPEYFAPEEVTDFDHYLDNETDFYYVVEMDGAIVGCGGLNYHPTEENKLRISWDATTPALQGKGIASKLTQYRIARAGEIDGIAILEVRTSQLVYKFYEKHGFELKEVVDNYWAEGFDLYRMEKML